MHTYVKNLAAGDTIRLPRDTRTLTLAADPEPVAATADVLRLTFLEDADLTVTMLAAADVVAVSMPRTVSARCLICRGDYTEDIDLCALGSNARGLCGRCSSRTTVRALQQRAAEIRRGRTSAAR
ncbi:hypothetical protein [Streptomyces pseudogriseolus]|uniref:hypothetical protein n=1 Tax=Streptomyces pseudogriseolus TaxID=36817 RepID=UPI003FA32B73